MMQSVETALFSLIRRELRLGDTPLTRDTQPSEIATWDSLSNAGLFVAIQSSFCQDLSFEDYISCATLGELSDHLVRLGCDQPLRAR